MSQTEAQSCNLLLFLDFANLGVGADFSFDVPSFRIVYLSKQVEPNLDPLSKVVDLI
jgi:hypothetical protein